MQLFFEEYDYPQYLIERYFLTNHEKALVQRGRTYNTKRIAGVGYFLNMDLSEHIFVLPKNFVTGNCAFNCLPIPKDQPINDSDSFRNTLLKSGWSDSLLTTLPLYLYQAIDKYRRQVRESSSIEVDYSQDVQSSKSGDFELTLLDISLSLQRFYYENQNLFVMVYKLAHSGYNKVQWGKTVRKKTPIIEDNDVIYPLLINKKKTINYDEELLVLFFNTLRYLNNKYQFRIKVDQPYHLMPDAEFERKLERGIIHRRLNSIKNNYFNEKLVHLWDLLFAFASKLSSLRKPGANNDYLFVRNFEHVFETMINTLLSDSDSPDVLVHQKDNKEVDHLFKGESITAKSLDIYYIGDSKYYISGHRPKYSALFKQYTYAKNIIQTEIDWFYSGEHEHLKYRDSLTEGYNLTPNFFISGRVEAGYNYTDDHLDMPRDEKGKPLPESFQKSLQFPNRIFDRDTLFLMQFDVNILFVIASYVSRSQRVRSEFKSRAKDAFKREYIRCIEEHYDFYLLKVKDGRTVDEVINRHFRAINGKVFCPYPQGHKHYGLLMMGLERKEFMSNMMLILSLQNDFIIKEYHLGTEPYIYYLGLLDEAENSRSFVLRDDLRPTMESHKQGSVVVAEYHTEEDLKKAAVLGSFPVKLADLHNHCPVKYRQRIFTSSYLFLYDPVRPEAPSVGFILTGTQYYNESTDELFLNILPMRFGGSLDLKESIAHHTNGTNTGPYFLCFEEASGDYSGSSVDM